MDFVLAHLCMCLSQARQPLQRETVIVLLSIYTLTDMVCGRREKRVLTVKWIPLLSPFPLLPLFTLSFLFLFIYFDILIGPSCVPSRYSFSLVPFNSGARMLRTYIQHRANISRVWPWDGCWGIFLVSYCQSQGFRDMSLVSLLLPHHCTSTFDTNNCVLRFMTDGISAFGKCNNTIGRKTQEPYVRQHIIAFIEYFWMCVCMCMLLDCVGISQVLGSNSALQKTLLIVKWKRNFKKYLDFHGELVLLQADTD